MAGTKNDGEALAAAVDLARDMGFDVTVEDITAAMNELKAGQREKTQQAVADIQALEDNALEDIAGGQVFWVNPLAKIIKREYGCKYNFTDDDCYLEDACEIYAVKYHDCEKTYFRESCFWEKDCFFREYAGD
jgi:hypothetical protein